MIVVYYRKFKVNFIEKCIIQTCQDQRISDRRGIGTYGTDENCKQHSRSKNLKGRDHMDHTSINERIILKWVLEEWFLRGRTG
jgi:hypothetical protein